MTNESLLDREIERELENLKTIEQGSKEHGLAVEAICKLHKARLDQMKLDLDRDKYENDVKLSGSRLDLDRDKYENDVKLSDRREANDEVYHERDFELKIDEKSDRRKKLIIDAAIGLCGFAGTVAGLVCYNRWFMKSLIFEKADSVSSFAGRNLINSMNKFLKN